jgi:hypothetical protein
MKLDLRLPSLSLFLWDAHEAAVWRLDQSNMNLVQTGSVGGVHLGRGYLSCLSFDEESGRCLVVAQIKGARTSTLLITDIIH